MLGPLLFLILIIDIDKDVTNTAFGSYVNDTKLWRGIALPSDMDHLQLQLETVYDWCSINNMQLNDIKFEAISIGQSADRSRTKHQQEKILKSNKLSKTWEYNFKTILNSALTSRLSRSKFIE